MYLEPFQITSNIDPFDCFPEQCYWSGLDEAPAGTREDYRGVLRDIIGDSPFIQLQSKVLEL